MNRKEQNSIMDRHNQIIAQILTRFRNMVLAATEKLPRTSIIPQASLNTMTMEQETAALIAEVENLLALNREIKTLWMRGPLRKPGDAAEQAREKELDQQAAKVAELQNHLIAMHNEAAKKMPGRQPASASASTAQEKKKKKEEEEQDGDRGVGGGRGSDVRVKIEDGGNGGARVKQEN
ncbi:hypothetical protein F5Y19DRAFT_112302 [Xylariaceae sp. FL1651]|nr:hypothetical protein F5Y19DRAFT_112302 [Xylariaceae sp. FL1651]